MSAVLPIIKTIALLALNLVQLLTMLQSASYVARSAGRRYA